jgi:hypothetical protein
MYGRTDALFSGKKAPAGRTHPILNLLPKLGFQRLKKICCSAQIPHL